MKPPASSPSSAVRSAGPVGLIAIAGARLLGAGLVFAVESKPDRQAPAVPPGRVALTHASPSRRRHRSSLPLRRPWYGRRRRRRQRRVPRPWRAGQRSYYLASMEAGGKTDRSLHRPGPRLAGARGEFACYGMRARVHGTCGPHLLERRAGRERWPRDNAGPTARCLGPELQTAITWSINSLGNTDSFASF
jgi:hypothetical protein